MSVFIVLPVYNVESTIVSFIQELLDEIQGLTVICSEDGSSDETRKIIEQHYSSVDQVILLEPSPRKGYALAVVDGVAAIRGQPDDVVIFSDSDAQISAREISKVYREYMEAESVGFHIATGCRSNRADGHLRLLMSRMWYALVKVLWPSISLRDPSSPLVVTSVEIAQKISNQWLDLGRRKIEGFWWEFQVIAVSFGLIVAEFNVVHETRKDGRATQVYKVRSILGILVRNLIDLIRLRVQLL